MSNVKVRSSQLSVTIIVSDAGTAVTSLTGKLDGYFYRVDQTSSDMVDRNENIIVRSLRPGFQYQVEFYGYSRSCGASVQSNMPIWLCAQVKFRFSINVNAF